MSSSKEPLKFSRRNLLKLMGFGAASAYLAACSPAATASPTALPTLAHSPTPVPPAATATAASTAVAVTNAKWSVSGNYFESCSCDYLCPCISQPDGVPTQGFCAFGMLFHIDQGRYMATQLDGLNLVVVGRSPEAMGNGNWSVGLITDDLASAEQAKALAAIFGGQDGGPMAAIAPVVGTYLGVEAQPIHYENTGMKRSVSFPRPAGPGDRRRGAGRRPGPTPVSRQCRPLCEHSAGAGPGGAHTLARFRAGLGQRHWQKQWALRAV